MHTADVYLNGQKLQRHVGGYLPFTVDITRQVKFGQENCLLVRLDNRDTGFHTNTIDVEVHDIQHLMRLLAALRAADVVNAVERV